MNITTAFGLKKKTKLLKLCIIALAFNFFCAQALAAAPLTPACSALLPTQPSSATTPESKINNAYWNSRYQDEKNQFSETNPKVLFVGDSLTNRWPPSIWAQHFASLSPLNLGLEGDRTQNVLWRLTNGQFLSKEPDAVILLIGTNNKESAPEIASGIATILNFIKQTSPPTKILLIGLLPRGLSTDDERIKTQSVNKLIQSCDDGKSIHYVDYMPLLVDPSGKLNANDYGGDKLHLSTAGYLAIADRLASDLKNLLRTHTPKSGARN